MMTTITTIKKNNSNTTTVYRNICIVMIWFITIYSSIIQYVFIQIPYGMLIMGVGVLLFYIMANSTKSFAFRDDMTEEDIHMLLFMAYIFVVGFLFAPNRNNHISQWVTCLEYLFVEIVIASIIKTSGKDTFHTLLFVISIALALILLRNPVEYQNTGRYSISNDVNPNGLGMALVAGIWAVLYRQSNKKQPLVFTGIIVALLGYCILLTGSRKSLIGAGLTIIMWLFLCFLPDLKGKSIWKGTITFFVMLIIIFIIVREFLSAYTNTTIATRMDKLFYEVSEGQRSDMYQFGFELIKRNPLFGIGFKGFQYYYGLYSHATLVEVPVSGGIIGAILYFYIYFVSLKKILYSCKQTKRIKDLYPEHKRIKMILVLWIMMAFYTICVIHPYQFESGIYFGIIFGETAYLESRIAKKDKITEIKKNRSKYIRNA